MRVLSGSVPSYLCRVYADVWLHLTHHKDTMIQMIQREREIDKMLPWCLPRPVATCGLQGRCSLQMTVRATHYWLPLERDTDGVPRRHCTPPSLSIRGDETPRQCPLSTSLTCTISMMPNNADRPIYGVIDGISPFTTTSSRRQHYLPARHRVRHANGKHYPASI